MKIALIGYGKMGREVEQVALSKGHVITARIDPFSGERTTPHLSPESVSDAEVCIEFSQPQAAVENIEKSARLKKNCRGWDHWMV